MTAQFALADMPEGFGPDTTTLRVRDQKDLQKVSFHLYIPGSYYTNGPMTAGMEPPEGAVNHPPREVTYFLPKSVARAIASALMGAAAEL